MADEQRTEMTRPVTEMMAEGLTVVRMENENMQAMAIQKPRQIAQLVKSAMDELRAFPEFAKKAYYSIPYKDRSGGEEKTVMVEGPSIKAANSLLRHWGNNSTGFRIVSSDAERVIVQGVFIDHETGMRRTAEMSVSRLARKRDGTYYPLAPDRLNMAIQAAGSKAVRNASLNALPVGLVERYFLESKTIAARGGKVDVATPAVVAQDINRETEQAIKAFENLGVSRQTVANYVMAHAELDDEEKVAAHLIGLLNALSDGATTLEEVFTVAPEQIKEPEPAKTAPNAQAGDSSGVKPTPVEKKKAPTTWRPMASKVEGGTCATCRQTIAKGAPIYFDPQERKAHHQTHFA